MSTTKREKREARIRRAVEDKLWTILKSKGEKSEAPPKEELQALSLAIKYLAVSAKLGEAEWGADIPGLTDPADEVETRDGLDVELEDKHPDTSDFPSMDGTNEFENDF